MGQLRYQPHVKLIIGLIFSDPRYLLKIKKILKRHFGRIDFESQIFPFTLTNYYEPEFGDNLKRAFISFEKLIRPERLATIKRLTNKLEHKLSKRDARMINIDPGYIDLAKLILASTKDYRHRIYLDKGIYAEITLYYQDRSFKYWEWTYPDYRSPEYIQVFNRIREIYAMQIAKK